MTPNTTNLYGGLSGVELVPDRFDVGEGVLLSRTYAHFMASFLMAFAPAAPGKPHPPPWRAAAGGLGYDITGELRVPLDFQPQGAFDRLNTIWWLTALIRLKITSQAFVPVISNEPFASIPAIKEEPQLWPCEVYTMRMRTGTNPIIGVDQQSLEWIRDHWISGSMLMKDESFSFAFQAFDHSIWSPNESLGLISLWGSLESLFSPSPYELSFRVSANIACFLEPPGEERYKCFRNIKQLYDMRSRVAHGDKRADKDSFGRTYEIGRRVLIKIIEANHIPGKAELEGAMFGDQDFVSRTTMTPDKPRLT